MAGFQDSDDEITGAINVTPLVDIMLVLLIIFMLVSSFSQKEAIEVDLPQASTGGKVKDEALSILLSKKGEYFLSGKKLESIDELKTILKRKRAANPDIQVIISADEKVYHGKVIKIIDTIRELQIYKFAINVEERENI